MTPASGRVRAFTQAVRNYWWIAAFGGVYFVGGFLAWGGTRGAVVSSGVFLVTGLAGLVAHHRGSWRGRRQMVALILAHQLIGQMVLVWQQAYLPLSDYSATGNPADRDFIIYLVSALIVGTMSMFGGALGAALGLGVHYGLVFDTREAFTFKWAFPVLIAALGNIVSTAFWRLDQAYDQLETLASHDHLTGLLNRRRLVPEFDRVQALARSGGRPLLAVAWDLDDLKPVNDRQGHAAGDALIRRFAEALGTHVRRTTDQRSGDAAFRVGGDEFISLHLDAPDGDALVARVHQAFPAVSAGWVRAEALTLDQAMTRADEALYRHKEARKSRGSTRPLDAHGTARPAGDVLA